MASLLWMEVRFFIHEPREFSQMGSGFAGECSYRFSSWFFAQFDSIAPAFSPFGPTVGCFTSCPPRHSVVVHMGGACGDRLAEEDLSVPWEEKENPGSRRQRLQEMIRKKTCLMP
jgi:hypothetical protein